MNPVYSFRIVEKGQPHAVHSIGYRDRESAQRRIDSGECNKHGWARGDGTYAYDTLFVVVPDTDWETRKQMGSEH